MLNTTIINKENMKKGAALGYTNATDVADYLVKEAPFRNAHEIVGEIVLFCIKKTLPLTIYP